MELNKIDSIGLGDPHAQQVSAALVNTPLPERVDPHGSYPPPHGHGHAPPHGGVPGGFGGFSSGFGGGYEGRERKRRRRISDRDAAAKPRERARAGGRGRGRAIDNRRAATVEGRAAFPILYHQVNSAKRIFTYAASAIFY